MICQGRKWDEIAQSVNNTLAGWLFPCISLSAFPLSRSQTTSSQATDDLMEGQGEKIQLSPELDGSHYGAAGGVRCPADSRESCDDKHMDRNSGGHHNRGYQADVDCLE